MSSDEQQRKPAELVPGTHEMSLGPFEDGFYRVRLQPYDFDNNLGALVRGLTADGSPGEMVFRIRRGQELALGFPAKLEY